MGNLDELERYASVILERLCAEPDRVFVFDEIVEGVDADKRVIRRVLASLVQRGLVERLPDYERRRMGFRAAPEACGQK
jgi:predicted transcriptional regulator